MKEDGSYDGQIRRLRLQFDGYVWVHQNFLYAIQLSFAPGDVGEFQKEKYQYYS
jgi:hypothetical protein